MEITAEQTTTTTYEIDFSKLKKDQLLEIFEQVTPLLFNERVSPRNIKTIAYDMEDILGFEICYAIHLSFFELDCQDDKSLIRAFKSANIESKKDRNKLIKFLRTLPQHDEELVKKDMK